VIAAAVLGLGVWFVITSGRRKEDFAARVLSQALATADKGNLPQASAELQRVIQTYSGTEAAGEAVLALNQIRMASGQSELAAVNLREFVSKNPPAKYKAQAFALLGAAEENAKRFPEAGKAYEQAATVSGFSDLTLSRVTVSCVSSAWVIVRRSTLTTRSINGINQ